MMATFPRDKSVRIKNKSAKIDTPRQNFDSFVAAKDFYLKRYIIHIKTIRSEMTDIYMQNNESNFYLAVRKVFKNIFERLRTLFLHLHLFHVNKKIIGEKKNK